MVNIRYASPNDIDFAFYCIQQLGIYEGVGDTIKISKETLEQWIFFNEICRVLVCEVDNIRVGIMLFYFNYSVYSGAKGIYLENIYIIPEYRGIGIGTQMMDALCEVAKKNLCKVINVSCLTNNLSANAFYKSYKMNCRDIVNNYELEV